jgi:hypothetical protein
MDKKRGERPRRERGRRGGRWKRNEEAEAVVENISRILFTSFFGNDALFY